MKIRVTNSGGADFDATGQDDADIRSAISNVNCGEAAPDFVAAEIADFTGISHDGYPAGPGYAIVTEDDGTELWSGWLDGRDEPAPLDQIALGQLVKDWEAAAKEESSLAKNGPWGDQAEHGNRAALLRDCARKLREALGQAS